MTDNLHERNRAIVADALNQRWKAQPDNNIGGWCVTVEAVPGTPADGNPPIVDFCTEQHARHVAALHNAWLAARAGDADDLPEIEADRIRNPEADHPESASSSRLIDTGTFFARANDEGKQR